jgi:hypothetical protein
VRFEYKLRVGNVVISLELPRDRDKRALAEYFGRRSDPRDGDIRIRMKIENKAARSASVPSSLFLTKVGGGDGFSAADGLIKGKFSPRTGEGELIIQSILMEGSYLRVFEQILYQAYWSAVRFKGLDSLLLHSSCMIRDGKGYVFTGKSGSGKSTVASMSAGVKVLNDEISVIDLAPRPAMLHDAPFNGFFKTKEEGSGPIDGIFLLKQAAFHRVERTKSAESIKTLAREIIPPMGLETPQSPKVYWEMLDIASRVAEKADLYSLEFLPNPEFWNAIDGAKRSS